ncbi:MAG: hypothetical protein MKZ75_05815, partial [Acidimicrobiales bacterium]|nr:hypothetical protein [Acidimicrobiales bacterium]
MSVFLYRLGRACVQHRWRTIGVWLIAAVALIGLNNTVGGQMTNGFVVPGLDSQEAYDLLAERFPAEGGISAQVVIEAPAGSLLSDPAQQTAITTMTQAFQSIEGVEVVVPPLLGQTVSENGTIGLFRIGYHPDHLPSLAMLEDLEEAGRESVGSGGALRVEFGGDLYNATEQPETGLGELLGLVSAV